MATGGSIEEVDIAGRNFPVAADADSNRKIGGFTNEHSPNGNGTGRLLKTREGWMVDGLALALDDLRGDQEFLQDVADGNGYVVMSVTYASGAIYSGQGQITGDLQSSSATTTAPLTLGGPGKFIKQ